MNRKHSIETFHKIGRISWTVAKQAHIKAADIVISANYLRHIANIHEKELSSLGMDAEGYVQFIVTNYNSIRQGSDDSILLVVETQTKLSHTAAIVLTYEKDKNYWQIKTAQPRMTIAVKKKKKLW